MLKKNIRVRGSEKKRSKNKRPQIEAYLGAGGDPVVEACFSHRRDFKWQIQTSQKSSRAYGPPPHPPKSTSLASSGLELANRDSASVRPSVEAPSEAQRQTECPYRAQGRRVWSTPEANKSKSVASGARSSAREGKLGSKSTYLLARPSRFPFEEDFAEPSEKRMLRTASPNAETET